MKNKLYIIAGAFLLLMIPFAMWWSSDDREIKRRSDHLMDVITISADTAGIFRQAKSLSINGMIAPKLEMQCPTISQANGTFVREDIESAFSWICRNAKESEFEIIEFVDVDIQNDQATVVTQVEGFIDISGKRLTDGISDVTLHWEKHNDDWVLAKIIWNEL